MNFDACGQSSTSNVSASFLFEVLSSATDRVSDRAVEVDGLCSHGLPSAGGDFCHGESTVSVGVKGWSIVRPMGLVGPVGPVVQWSSGSGGSGGFRGSRNSRWSGGSGSVGSCGSDGLGGRVGHAGLRAKLSTPKNSSTSKMIPRQGCRPTPLCLKLCWTRLALGRRPGVRIH